MPTTSLTGGLCPASLLLASAAACTPPAQQLQCTTHVSRSCHPLPPLAQDPQQALSVHNAERAKRGAAPLAWSASLAAGAQAYANRCVFEHSGSNGVGENLYT